MLGLLYVLLLSHFCMKLIHNVYIIDSLNKVQVHSRTFSINKNQKAKNNVYYKQEFRNLQIS